MVAPGKPTAGNPYRQWLLREYYRETKSAPQPFLGWREGAFLRAYTRNQVSSNELALDASPITEPVRRLVADGDFQGTATDLLQVLTERSDDPTRRQKGWPTNAQGLSNTLRRLAPNLRKVGVEVAFTKGKDRRRRRLIVLRDIASTSSDASGERVPK